MSFKKSIFNIALALSLALGASIATAPKAHAYLLLEGASGATPADGPWSDGFWMAASSVTICVIVLPICLLDEKSDGSVSVTKSHLLANGYSNAEISKIMKDQAATSSGLKAQHMQLKILPNDSRESIAQDILSVNPRASQTYIDFVSDSSGL